MRGCESSPHLTHPDAPLTQLQRVEKWFYNHGGPSKKREATVPPFDFGKPMRKLVPLTLYQAYSVAHCAPGSALYKELHAAWKLYMSRDEATVEKYKDLFPAVHNPNLPYVSFQQVVLRNKLATATEEELESIWACVDNRFEKETALRERPWDEEGKADGIASEVDMERQYVYRYVLPFIMLLATNLPPFVVKSKVSQRRSSLFAMISSVSRTSTPSCSPVDRRPWVRVISNSSSE